MFRNLKLKYKLISSYGVIALIVLIVALLGYKSAESMHDDMVELYQEDLVPIECLMKIRVNLDRIWADTHRYALVPHEQRKLREEVARAGEEISAQMKLILENDPDREEKEWLEKLEGGMAVYRKAVDDTLALIDSGDDKDAVLRLQEGHAARNARNGARGPLEKLTELQMKSAEKLHARSERHFIRVHYTNIGSGILGVLLAVILGFAVARAITKPLGKVVSTIDEMSRGELNGALVDDGSRDEIGQLTRAAVAIAATLKEVTEDLQRMISAVDAGALSYRIDSDRHQGEYGSLLKGINQLTDTITRPLLEVAEVMQKVAGGDTQGRMAGAYEGELRAMKSNVNRSLDSLGSLLGELSEVAEKLARGDLRSNLRGAYQGDFAIMQTNMNAAVDELRRTLGEIAAGSQHIAVAATETSVAAGDVASQSEKQLVMLTEVVTVISQTAQSVRDISINAEKGNVLARDTAAYSQEGREQLAKLAQAVEVIAAGNERVARISDRISRIAEKTHILALNAGIEAARAGEQGLGFGIVAQQIGKLAEEASAAVTDISALTVEASRNAAGGVTAAVEARNAIERIAQAARDNELTVHMIAGAIVQQSAAVEQLAANVADVEARGESNAAAATEISATMESLSQMIHKTADQIGRFVLS